MSNSNVAFAALAALFWLYVVLALSRSRLAGSAKARGRRSWRLLIAWMLRAGHVRGRDGAVVLQTLGGSDWYLSW